MGARRGLKTMREDRGLSQRSAADRIGVSQQTISGWEAGTQAPEFERWAAIADAYKVETLEVARAIDPDLSEAGEKALGYVIDDETREVGRRGIAAARAAVAAARQTGTGTTVQLDLGLMPLFERISQLPAAAIPLVEDALDGIESDVRARQ